MTINYSRFLPAPSGLSTFIPLPYDDIKKSAAIVTFMEKRSGLLRGFVQHRIHVFSKLLLPPQP